MNTSIAPERFISSRTIASTFLSTRVPIGSHVYKPDANLRIIPARNMSWCEITSASFGVSLNVANKKRLARMEKVLKVKRYKNAEYTIIAAL
ncbi:hypothetical protein D9M71_834500 [compost metagenome]